MLLNKIFNDLNRLKFTGKCAYYASAVFAGQGCALTMMAIKDYGWDIFGTALKITGTHGVTNTATISAIGFAADLVKSVAADRHKPR